MIRITNKKGAFRVVACDNLGTIQGERDRTWDVINADGLTVSTHTTRGAAREDARQRNAEANDA